MTNKQNLLWQTFGLLPFLFLAACSTDDAPGSGTDAELVPVTIRLDVENSGVQTRADGSAGTITNDSEINTLDVYIISNETTELHLRYGDFTDNVAEVELSEGRKTIRAVANAGENPASTLDATALISADNGIPMSTTQDTTWNVTASQLTYDVRLNRMVGQIKVTLKDDRGTQKGDISSVSISELPTTTNLYRERHGKVSLPEDVAMTGSWDWEVVSGTNENSFYLHETNAGGTVTVNVGGTERVGTFSRSIPRNHILPLEIHITDYSLAIGGRYTYASIGVQPIEAEIEPNGYRVPLPEGSSDIMITLKLKDNTSGGSDITSGVDWKYKLPTEADIYFDAESETNATLTLTADAIPALSGDNWVIPITATYNETNYQFSLTISVVGLEDIQTRSGAGKQSEGPVIIEL